MKPLTIEEKACNDETWSHINRVAYFLIGAAKHLLDRSLRHDQSKLKSPEVQVFATAPKLEGIEFGSAEYKSSCDYVAPALAHHYAYNRHHPEHFKNGVEDMNIFDVIEMYYDWMASSERNKNGNIRKSIEMACEKYKINSQLRRILENTVDVLPRE